MRVKQRGHRVPKMIVNIVGKLLWRLSRKTLLKNPIISDTARIKCPTTSAVNELSHQIQSLRSQEYGFTKNATLISGGILTLNRRMLK